MPLYEYYCSNCNGIFEALRPMRESSEPVPCPECYQDAPRIMPTSFAAFTFRDGYPRRIPDKGTYWHLGQEVRRPINEPTLPNEHPDLYRKKQLEKQSQKPAKGDIEAERDRKVVFAREEKNVKQGYQQDIAMAGIQRQIKGKPPTLN